MKILNLYAGLGGNRKLWGDEHEITAVEISPDIANIYKDFFPNDTVIVGDAHQYLLEHYKEFDFIWSSPPCQTHSIINTSVPKGWDGKHNRMKARYIDLKLYQEIILLMQYANKTKWVIENVKPYYEPLIKPSIELHRHYFWSNFYIEFIIIQDKRKHDNITGKENVYGFDIKNKKISKKRTILRNLVNPEIGKYILDQAMNIPNENQLTLF
jgi:DNA (cytosine-5)-methyltransferase 1